MEILHIDPKVLILQAVSFFLLVLVFKLFLFKPVMAVLDARRKEIEGQFSDAQSQKSEADRLKADYEKRLVAIEDEARAKINEAVKDGQRMREEILADSREQSDKILTKAQEEIAREKEKAMIELKGSVVTIAIGAAERLIEDKLDDASHHALISKFIDELDEVKS